HSIFKVIDWLKAQNLGLATRLRLGWKLLHSPRKRKVAPGVQEAARVSGNRHSVARDQQAVTYHYDISNDFYALFLDKNLIYSCAYFEHDGEDLDTAQERKLDYLCRKLRLKPGERLLDIGCGWGGLVIHAAKQYGVEALGITLSQPQVDLANERIRQAGLSDRCRVEVRDYRQVSGTFDKLVSVGMFEHVGEDLLPAYFQKAWDLLPEGGVFLNHGIGRNTNIPWNRRTTFLNRYVFPDGELEPIHHTLQEAEKVGFEVRDVESLREHYALTLRHWMRHLEANHEKVLQCVSESTYRVWRLYMAGSVRGFDIGRVNLYQTLLVKAPRQSSGLPWTRADWYVGG
ncbi:MAG: cyclopropane-fatty-acyl-phospholipid synthase family protein, partial [Chloroflexota bacterium]|nr:cyclopropane-fatty-acyl-phospholipid synthase family protein [Chloroflexota bacterium]